MPKSSVNASLSSYDDIFSTEESRQEEQREQVQQIPIGELFPFKNHPFKVLDDDSMSDTVESVKQYGVLSPLIARPRPKGGYEIISGHRRQHAAELAGLETLPVIVRQMDDDAAIILMVDDSNPIIRSEEVTIDMHICAALSESRSSGEIYFAAIAPDMELTVITLDEAPDILPCFDEDDAYLNIPDSSLLLSYNPAQVLKLAGKHYLTGPVILVRTNMDGEFISLTIDQVYLFQKYLMRHSVTLMADGQKLPCICME